MWILDKMAGPAARIAARERAEYALKFHAAEPDRYLRAKLAVPRPWRERAALRLALAEVRRARS